MKKIKLLLIPLLLLFSLNVNASTKVFERTSENNYGIKKNIEINDYRKNRILETKYVDASEKIYDYADLLTDLEEAALKTKIDEFRNKYHTEIVIVTIDSPYTYESWNDEYAEDFYDYNDFGLDTKHHDGIILLRNAYQQDPYYCMSMIGNAQIYLDEDRFNNILDDIYANISNKRYLNGFTQFISECSNYYDKGIPSSMRGAYLDDHGFIAYKKLPYSVPVLLSIVIASIVTLITMIILVRKNKTVKKALEANDYLDKSSIVYTRKNRTLVNSIVTHYTIQSSSSGGHGGGGGFSHGGSSGFGHSGGGRHG